MGRRKKDKQVHFTNVELLSAGGEGHALAKVEGKVIFVKYGAPGDIVDVQIVSRKKRFSLANITAMHKESDLRVKPFCEHYGVVVIFANMMAIISLGLYFYAWRTIQNY